MKNNGNGHNACGICGTVEKRMYSPSKCCGTHWELVVQEGRFYLVCEKCGKPAADKEIVISGGTSP